MRKKLKWVLTSHTGSSERKTPMFRKSFRGRKLEIK